MTATATEAMTRDGRQGRLMRGYLHKTSNNLCGIKGYASLIAAGDADRQVAQWARQILAEVELMERIYRSVQDMAFAQPAEPAGGDLAAVVTAAVAAVRTRCAGLTVRILGGSAAPLLLPARDLQLALEELLTNAAEAAAPGGARVTISTVAGRRGRLQLRVADDGPGLLPAILARAADPFVTTKPGRLGIGLARVDTLMDMYALPWSLANRPGGGALVALEVARATTTTTATPARTRKESNA
jgi:C4-dicarboxylate-specific signal transduction histidine kinase